MWFAWWCAAQVNEILSVSQRFHPWWVFHVQDLKLFTDKTGAFHDPSWRRGWREVRVIRSTRNRCFDGRMCSPHKAAETLPWEEVGGEHQPQRLQGWCGSVPPSPEQLFGTSLQHFNVDNILEITAFLMVSVCWTKFFLLRIIKEMIQGELPSRLKHRFGIKHENGFSRLLKSQRKLNNHCSVLWYSSDLPNSQDVSTTGPGSCLKYPDYFQILIFWKAAERQRVHLRRYGKIVSAGSKGTMLQRHCPGTWMVPVPGIPGILQGYLMMQHISPDRCFAAQGIPKCYLSPLWDSHQTQQKMLA